jgi:hypothetical protein
MVGTTVREEYEASMANETASANGTNNYSNTSKEKHRHEHDADRQSGDEGRNCNLLGTIENRVFDFFAKSKVAVDVLDFHGRVIDQDADRQRQPAERHDIDGFAQCAQADD